ncbi:MAG: flagellar motor protein MotB [Flavobacteriaceae bacterium]|nr:MAG: flagellar motor protein MotB [Flavobacteriaceae bacterium]
MSSTSIFAQQGKQKKATELFNSFSFIKSIEKYEKLVAIDFNKEQSLQKIGDAYMMLRQPESALKYYSQVTDNNKLAASYYYNYAQALRGTKQYKASEKWMEKFKNSAVNDSRGKLFFTKNKLINSLKNNTKYILSNHSVNTALSDFGGVDYNDNMLFVSARDKGVSIIRKYAWNEQPFLDIYTFNSGEVSKVAGDVNSIFHEGVPTFSSDKKRMYFTRNNYLNHSITKDDKGTVNLKIYTAELEGNQWKNIKETSINNDQYSVGHPSLNADGSKLYFTSDMPGSVGGSDIYVSEVHSDGTLGTPKNLGSSINTEGNEMFPFIHKNGALFFSSDGHVGLGLQDVFVAIQDKNNVYTSIVNLGSPINSNKDDFAYFLDDKGRRGYISSNRDGGKGDDDIYSFKRTPPLKVKGQIFDDANNQPLGNARIVLQDSLGKEIAYFITKEDGKYEHYINRNSSFLLEGNKEKYTSASRTFNTYKMDDKDEFTINLNINFTLKPIQDVVILADLKTIYFDLDKSFIRPDAAIELDKVVTLLKKYPEMIIRLESHTDSRGNDAYNLALSERRAKSTYDYIINNGITTGQLTSYKGFGETQLINHCANSIHCTIQEHQLNRRTEFIILQMKN